MMSEMSGEQDTKRFFGPDYYGEQDENGIDLSLIRENLRLTPLERIRKGDAARRQALRLLEYGRRHRENSVREDH
jgi:hypothetical protein